MLSKTNENLGKLPNELEKGNKRRLGNISKPNPKRKKADQPETRQPRRARSKGVQSRGEQPRTQRQRKAQQERDNPQPLPDQLIDQKQFCLDTKQCNNKSDKIMANQLSSSVIHVYGSGLYGHKGNPSGKVAHVTCMLHACYMQVTCMLPITCM